MITRPEEHDIDRAGKRLLRAAVEKLGWILNDVQEDYGIDSNIQVFDGSFPTGAWFHVQLKSSRQSEYSTDQTFISQALSVDHARHYGLDMRQPVLVIHVDVTAEKVYWYFPQLDKNLANALSRSATRSATVSRNLLNHPAEAPPKFLHRLLYVHVITALESYLSDFLISKVLGDQAMLRRFMAILRHKRVQRCC